MTHVAEPLNKILPERRESTLSSVVVLPEDLEFETQNPNERVFILLRRHIATNTGWIVTLILFALLPIFLFVLSGSINWDFLAEVTIKEGYVVAIVLSWYSLLFSYAFMKFLDWYFNIYVITSERILDFDFSPFAYHKISEAGLESIVDATQENIGFLPMLFNYGDVYVQTSGEKREFDFTSVAHPAWVRDKIMDLRDMIVSQPK